MKHKILLCGHNRAVRRDFFTHMEFSFECMTTSNNLDDVKNHVKYFKPDLMVYCLKNESREMFEAAARMRFVLTDGDIPVVVVGDKADCSEFARTAPGMSKLELNLPLSTKDIESRVNEYLDKRDLQRKIALEAEEERKRQEEERKRKEEEERKRQEEEARRAEEEANSLDIPEMAIPEAMMPKEPEGPKHILIVDDDAGMLRMMKNYLSEDYQVATAISGKVALKFLETKHTDLVLLDYEMPGENGADVLSEIRKNPGLKNLPVVFLTGVTDRSKIQQVLSNNIQGYLLKPINVERLSDTIVGLLQ